ncbi:MAG: hypothetical protein IKI99_03440, partial [Firmicutes bacterium]|nr:hypothetical protein [Bacillota bacterium]
MKKIISIFMMAALVLTTGCALGGGNREGEKLLESYLENVDAYEASTRELGEPASYIHMDERIAVAILYPETGLEPLDVGIRAWAEETAEEYKRVAEEEIIDGDSMETEDGEIIENRAELTVSYESYYAGENKVGVKLSGTFISPALAHPVDII